MKYGIYDKELEKLVALFTDKELRDTCIALLSADIIGKIKFRKTDNSLFESDKILLRKYRATDVEEI